MPLARQSKVVTGTAICSPIPRLVAYGGSGWVLWTGCVVGQAAGPFLVRGRWGVTNLDLLCGSGEFLGK